MESEAGIPVAPHPTQEPSRLNLTAHLDGLIVKTRFKWQAQRIQDSICNEIGDLVKQFRIKLLKDEVHADSPKKKGDRQYEITLSFTLTGVTRCSAQDLQDCLNSFIEEIDKRQATTEFVLTNLDGTLLTTREIRIPELVAP